MAALVFFVLILGTVVLITASSLAAERRRRARARELADELGLTLAPARVTTWISMTGSIDGFSVQIERHPSSAKAGSALITVSGNNVIPRDLVVRRSFAHNKGSETETGDLEFDRSFVIDGDPARVSSFLTESVRSALQSLPESASVTIDCGQLTAVVTFGDSAHSNAIVVRRLVEIAQKFAEDSASPAERLLRELRWAKSIGVATTSFRRLMESKPPENCAREAVEHAIASEDPLLLNLAVPYARPQHAERLREIFRRFSFDDQLRATTLHALRRIYEPPPADLPVLLVGAGRRTREAIAVFLGTDERLRDEPALFSLLNDVDQDVQTSAARSLARVGTVLALDPLREWSKGLFRSVEVKELADEAIRAIQSRTAVTAAPGQLSLASGEREPGAVSLSTSTGGGLSIDAGDEDND